jgi:HNH endonuclease
VLSSTILVDSGKHINRPRWTDRSDTLVPAQHAPGPQLDLGRRTRTIPPPLRRALTLRDRGCRYPACTNHFFLHAHHIVHRAHGGTTDLTNLVTLCGAHHRLLHEGGFHVHRNDEGHLAFTDERGKPIDAAPVAPDLDGEGIEVVTAWNEGAGLEIDAGTGFPGWDGERMDYAWTGDSLYRG